MKDLIGEKIKLYTADNENCTLIEEDIKNFLSNEEDHMALHAAHTIDNVFYEERLERLEAFNKTFLIGVIVVGITTIVVAATADTIKEKITSFKEKRKAKHDLILEDTAE